MSHPTNAQPGPPRPLSWNNFSSAAAVAYHPALPLSPAPQARTKLEVYSCCDSGKEVGARTVAVPGLLTVVVGFGAEVEDDDTALEPDVELPPGGAA